ncbi:MAG: Hsp20/alpha crystallin family protein [Candidatus Hydrogenedentes bacterium]|nr:Hsp20/alpha crystallin family protein [Candidatus Hydrogenedentota bacterium]
MTTACATQCEAQAQPALRQVTPRANIYEAASKVYVEVEVPGVKKEDLTLRVESGQLHFEARRYGKGAGEQPEPLYAYSRNFTLASHLDAENIAAQYENGVLRLEIPRKETGRVIPVV